MGAQHGKFLILDFFLVSDTYLLFDLYLEDNIAFI